MDPGVAEIFSALPLKQSKLSKWQGGEHMVLGTDALLLLLMTVKADPL